jgi:hypothetical protein
MIGLVAKAVALVLLAAGSTCRGAASEAVPW